MLRILLEFKERKIEVDGGQVTAVALNGRELPDVRLDGEPEPTARERDFARNVMLGIQKSMGTLPGLKVIVDASPCGCPECTKAPGDAPEKGELH